jgi:hypothetical protein
MSLQDIMKPNNLSLYAGSLNAGSLKTNGFTVDYNGNIICNSIKVLNSTDEDNRMREQLESYRAENQELKKLIGNLQEKVSIIDSLCFKMNELNDVVKKNPVINIEDYIEQSLLNKIHKLQEKTDKNTGTCCVCLEEDLNIVPIKCKHELCNNCVVSLRNNSCPICRQTIERISIRKSIAVFTKINLNAIGVFYLPPIIEDSKCTEHDVFTNITNNADELRRLLSVCDQISSKSYLVVQNGNVLDQWKKFNAVKELKFVDLE